MIKLLVSVKNSHEAQLAAEAGADLIDLKDPEIGALGSLDNAVIQEIMQVLPHDAIVSMTIGDKQSSAEELIMLVECKAKLGAHFVKLPVSDYLFENRVVNAFQVIQSLYGTKFIAVFNASHEVDLMWLEKLHNVGFYGAMLDTFDKSQGLINSQGDAFIQAFVKQCKKHKFYVGLAGALKQEMLGDLVVYAPDYLGFRSGVCKDNLRKNKLLASSVIEIKHQLYKHNIIGIKSNNMSEHIA